jgi:hypothetical protein
MLIRIKANTHTKENMQLFSLDFVPKLYPFCESSCLKNLYLSDPILWY